VVLRAGGFEQDHILHSAQASKERHHIRLCRRARHLSKENLRASPCHCYLCADIYCERPCSRVMSWRTKCEMLASMQAVPGCDLTEASDVCSAYLALRLKFAGKLALQRSTPFRVCPAHCKRLCNILQPHMMNPYLVPWQQWPVL
jgi:hypothetical protein